jgi:hypothetical protein
MSDRVTRGASADGGTVASPPWACAFSQAISAAGRRALRPAWSIPANPAAAAFGGSRTPKRAATAVPDASNGKVADEYAQAVAIALPLVRFSHIDLSANAGREGFDGDHVTDLYQLLAEMGRQYGAALQLVAVDNDIPGAVLSPLDPARQVLTLTQDGRLIRLTEDDRLIRLTDAGRGE